MTIAVTNRLPMPASIHWHGMRIPAEMDGVPGLSYAGIAPALLRLAGGCACGYRFRSNARMGRNRHTGTGSVLLQFRANAVCPRRRTRRGKNLRLVRLVPHSTPDIATSSRIAQIRSLHRVRLLRRIRPDRYLQSSGRATNGRASICIWDLVVALIIPRAVLTSILVARDPRATRQR